MNQIGSTFWSLLLLLAVQGTLSATRAVVIHTPWGHEEESGNGRPEITQISVTLDLLFLILGGVYWTVGLTGLSAWLQLSNPAPAITQALAADWSTLTTVGLLILLGWINLSLGVLGPEAFSRTLPDVWRERMLALGHALHWIFRPLSASALALANAFSVWIGGKPLERAALITEEQIKTLVTAGEQEGIIEEEEREMIYSIFRLRDTLTREIMIPRIDIIALDVETPISDVITIVIRSGHSRFPVYDETIDNIIGVLHVKDLLQHGVASSEGLSLSQVLRPAYFIPESKRLDDLLREMQHNKIQQAIVVDEYGGVAGLVTLEDIMEEIVGEIQDEYDREEPEVIRLGEETFMFDARIPLDDVQELLATPLPLEEADSLGGFVYNQLGHIPAVGEQLNFGPIEFEVAEITGRRIRKVRATRIREPNESHDEDTSS